jgi:hypothetical protein
LSARVQRSTQAAAPDPSLNTSLVNLDILTELIRALEKLCTDHPAEARTEFKRPLEWSSPTLRPSLFPTTSNSGWHVTNQARYDDF